MDRQQLIARLNEITGAAAERMNAAPTQPELVYAEIMWMNQDEVAERHGIVMLIHSLDDSPDSARNRILCKRRLNKNNQPGA